MNKLTWFLVATLGLSASHVANADQLLPEEIMHKVYTLYDGETRVSRQSISTCKYGISNRKIACSETPRIKVSESYGKDFGDNGEDAKSLTVLIEPAAERGIGILQYDYGDVSRDSDQWIYLSALGKPKRVATGNADDEDEPKKGSLFGSEFSLEDMEKVRPKDYTYSILKEVTYNQRPCWIIQMTPTEKRARNSNYSKMVVWVDRERFQEYKVQYYDRKGVYVKQKTQVGWQQQGDIWYSRKTIMNNKITKRISILDKEQIVFNVAIDDEFLTIRSLSDAAFRERNMEELKGHFSYDKLVKNTD
ncbi:outer membrane lipoprotein-sorting protein [Saccharobesus litoralis]|uniref:Outer membrane lipoprotein-sorting protein n=1 Tax=Saccharobesus litoralis TaxID=2172099 RepID=A0A2S0VNA3_9ALTE|nr:outer membrane lipoprotein-sorting protein [Saccharobesus litoralis]AWB65693.1 outer membrane lipoprotein-sorting protein [Saccharobesus litoralis]